MGKFLEFWIGPRNIAGPSLRDPVKSYSKSALSFHSKFGFTT
jgi:hypothetical protein